MYVFYEGQVSGKWLQTRKINEPEKLKSSKADIHCYSTEYFFWEFQKISQ